MPLFGSNILTPQCQTGWCHWCIAGGSIELQMIAQRAGQLVLPMPGASSINTWPPDNMAAKASRTCGRYAHRNQNGFNHIGQLAQISAGRRRILLCRTHTQLHGFVCKPYGLKRKIHKDSCFFTPSPSLLSWKIRVSPPHRADADCALSALPLLGCAYDIAANPHTGRAMSSQGTATGHCQR